MRAETVRGAAAALMGTKAAICTKREPTFAPSGNRIPLHLRLLQQQIGAAQRIDVLAWRMLRVCLDAS